MKNHPHGSTETKGSEPHSALFLLKNTLVSLQDVLSSQVQHELPISHRRPQLRKVSTKKQRANLKTLSCCLIFFSFKGKNNHCLSCFVAEEGEVERSSRPAVDAALLPLPHLLENYFQDIKCCISLNQNCMSSCGEADRKEGEVILKYNFPNVYFASKGCCLYYYKILARPLASCCL